MKTDRDIVEALGSVGTAFFGGFSHLRAVQRRAIAPILAGEDVLVASATASGKTEAVIAPMVARVRSLSPTRRPRIRILVVAPTRALVNDLAARLEAPMDRLGLDCGRQTSDHRDKGKRPFLLVTTPESLDSMLVRDGQWIDGTLVDHLLAGVAAVFLDEAHLYDGTSRGDQLRWLVGRLRRLRRFHAERRESNRARLQICSGSATISDPENMARRLLGSKAIVVQAPGIRDIDVFGPSGDPKWFPLESSMTIATLLARLDTAPSDGFERWAEKRLQEALFGPSEAAMRKVLAFVPTRALSDKLSAQLADSLAERRDIAVLGHHGSLSRDRRERAEQSFARARDAVLVATTTMEVGVDIGDVDLVALVGAPPGTRSLLQRIGRAGRRIGRARVLALPRDEVEQAALASMLISARDGILEPERYGRRWSVFVQQVASFVAQGRGRGRRRRDLASLAQDVWPESPPTTADSIVDELVAAGHVVERRDRLFLGGDWDDSFDGGRGMHANIGSSGMGLPVVDASTGEVIACVAQAPDSGRGLALGGQKWAIQGVVKGELLLKIERKSHVREGFVYAARRAPTRHEYAIHIRRGLGLDDHDAPILDGPNGWLWLHFGGSAYQALLCRLEPKLRVASGLAGLAVQGRPDAAVLPELAATAPLSDAVDPLAADLEPLLEVGPYQRLLPSTCRAKVVADLIGLPAFQNWLATRRVWEMTQDHPQRGRVESTLGIRA